MLENNRLREMLERMTTADLWIELARRLNLRFGKIQMAIHDGRPSKYATVDMRISTDEEKGVVQTDKAE
jgi:hypothetical protein